MAGAGARLGRSNGITPDELKSIRNTVGNFMNAGIYGIPGMSLAIARDDNLVYVDSFGTANLTTNQKVDFGSLFRIASVTKPITAATICRLVNAGLLSLDALVFGPGSLLGDAYTPYATPTNSSNLVTAIKVRHLLNHTAGGWFNSGTQPGFFDPVFSYLSAQTPQALIAAALGAMPLAYPPGQVYGYSNLGYSILGRVIEAVTKKSYAQAVAEWVFMPCNVTDMRLAGNSAAPREVSYYESGAVVSYNPVIVPRLDSFGGWVANPSDLVNILMRLDGIARVADILPLSSGAVSLTDMVTPPSTVQSNYDNPGQGDYYALGWSTGRPSPSAIADIWSHDGDLAGASAYLQRDTDANGHVYCWAILTNTRVVVPPKQASPFLGLISQIKATVSSWDQ